MASKELHFINSNGAKLPKDPSVRKLIRKQAMKNVAEERKNRGNHGRINLGQLPSQDQSPFIFVKDTTKPSKKHCKKSVASNVDNGPEQARGLNGDDDALHTLAVTSSGAQRMNQVKHLPVFDNHIFISPYETARSKYGIDVTQLSALAGFNVGQNTKLALAANPSRLATLIGESRWSYLSFVPARYDFSECLAAATDCLLATIQGILLPHTRDEVREVKLYLKAIRLLQKGLSDAYLYMDSDILCASQLLSLHELLDTSNNHAWSKHIRGTSLVVRHRTAASFKDEYSRAILAAHLGPIWMDSMMNHTACYLEDPEWKDVLESSAINTPLLTHQSPLAIRIRAAILKMPGLWAAVDDAVSSNDLFDDEKMAHLETECRDAHENLTTWMNDYKSYCVGLLLEDLSASELEVRRELYGMALECLAVAKRLLMATCGDDEEIQQLETETQQLAQLLLQVQEAPSPRYAWLFSTHEINIASSIMSTPWRSLAMNGSQMEQKMATRLQYTAWSTAMGRSGRPGEVMHLTL